MAVIEQIKSRLAEHRPGLLSMDFPEAGVLVPVTSDVRSPEIVLTRRADHLRTHRGQVAFPCGRRDQGDESLLHMDMYESHAEVRRSPGLVAESGDHAYVATRVRVLHCGA